MLMALVALAQGPVSSKPLRPSNPIERGLDLAAKGLCDDALPLLQKLSPEDDKELRYKSGMAVARCAMKRRDGRATVNALLSLKHDFPEDPEVLYLTTRVFLQIAETASTDLARIAPNSYQVRTLQAESLESQNKWEEAAEVYREILQESPNAPELHLRLGRAIMAEPESEDTDREAKQEFQRELAIDPSNASAHFWLGEIAHRDGEWAEAISQFASAIKLDGGLWTAHLGLGMALNSAGRFSQAISPLERYTAAMPQDAAGHYQLATAYRHAGRKQDADRETAIHQQLNEKQQEAEAARAGIKTQ
jgi:predicted Zn-dependent protease